MTKLSQACNVGHRLISKYFYTGISVFYICLVACNGCGEVTEGHIFVPCRVCVIKGSSWTRMSAQAITSTTPIDGDGYYYGEGDNDIDYEVLNLFKDVNQKIWNPGANISFFPMQFPNNPWPPGLNLNPYSGDNSSHYAAVVRLPDFQCFPPPCIPEFCPNCKGRIGDIYVNQNFGGVSTSMTMAFTLCDITWKIGGENSNYILVIIARDLIQSNGNSSQAVGVDPGHHSILQRNSGNDLCQFPPNITSDDIRTQYAIIADPYLFSNQAIHDPHTRYGGGLPYKILAHELGHVLMLAHGDGLDNDNNGVFDSECDPGELESGQLSLMSVDGSNTTITPLQRKLARKIAINAPGAVINGQQ